MIRVIVQRKLKKHENIGQLLQQIKVAAIKQRGYITGETYVDTENPNIITVISTWKSLEDWRIWESSEQRAMIYHQIEPLLDEPPTVTTHKIMSPEELEYLEDPTGWFESKEHPVLEG